MKALVVVMSLTLASQAVAGKRLSELLAIAWPQLSVATIATAGSLAMPDSALVVIISQCLIGGAALSMIKPLLDTWGEWLDEIGQDRVGKEILYIGEGGIKRGKALAYTSIKHDNGGLHIAGEATPTFHFQINATSIPDHHDIDREVELLTEADDAEALHYAGVVVTVFDNGSYELELFAKVDVQLDPSVTDDVAAYHKHYIDIEPRRLIVAKNVALKDGGFRFARQARELTP